MLIQFSVKNYYTFKEKATLSFVASNYDKKTKEDENIFQDTNHNLRLLKSCVIYGANASGKSKFIDALLFMKFFVITSSKDSQKGDDIPIKPFLLNSKSEKEPSEFELIFTIDNIMYRYGFEVTGKLVVSEWLYAKPKTKEVALFYRDYQNFEIHKRNFQKVNRLVKDELIRDNALLLSVAAQFNEETAVKIIESFYNIAAISDDTMKKCSEFTISKLKDADFKSKILELLKVADFGIQDIKAIMLDMDNLPGEIPKELKKIMKKESEKGMEFSADVRTSYNKFDENNNLVGKANLSLYANESLGTKKFFRIAGPILYSLENGHTLVIDELDSKLHPNLVAKIVSLFHTKKTNPKNAQLLFNTHNINLLSADLFRRDQVWFTEKNKYGEGLFFSLADFKSDKVRKDDSFEDNYIKGKYGAVPYLGYFDYLLNHT